MSQQSLQTQERSPSKPEQAARAALDPLAVAASGEQLLPVQPASLDVTVIVPITSAQAEVADVLDGLGHELEREGRSHEFVLVFDGVRGKAWSEAQSFAERLGDRLRLISFESPFGESVCLSAGFELSRGRTIVTSPQYVQIDPLELSPMLGALSTRRGSADSGGSSDDTWPAQRCSWLR